MTFEIVMISMLFVNILVMDYQFLNPSKFLFLNLTIDEFASYALAKVKFNFFFY